MQTLQWWSFPEVDQPKAIIGPIDDLSFVPNISIGNVILACAPHENPAVVQNSNKYFQLPSFGDKTMPANDAANVTTLNKIVFRLPTMSYNRLNTCISTISTRKSLEHSEPSPAAIQAIIHQRTNQKALLIAWT